MFHLSLEQQSPDGFVKVYRFENAIGEGPYIGYPVEALIYHNSVTGHPPLIQEKEEDEHGNPVLDTEFNMFSENLLTAWETKFNVGTFVCAFRSMDQLNAWFVKDEIEAMANHGYHLTSYLIPKEYIMYGGKQVLIHKEYKIKCEL